MKIVVLNGSPKGNNSITMSYVKYLQLRYPDHDLTIKTVALSLPRLEKNEAAFQELISEIHESEAVIWAFPLYFMLVHSNFKRFIELIWERKAEQAFKGKYGASLSTSIHFYDHTANNYIQAISEDLGMNFVSSFSPEMHDLMDAKKRSNLEKFFEEFINAVEEKASLPKAYPTIAPSTFNYVNGPVDHRVDLGNLRVVVAADHYQDMSPTDNLSKMIQRFQNTCNGRSEERRVG